MKLALNRALTVPKTTVSPLTLWSSVWGVIQNHPRSPLEMSMSESCFNPQESALFLWLCVLSRTNKQTKHILTIKNPSTLRWSNLYILKDSLQSSRLMLVLYCHVTHRPKMHRLQTTHMYCLTSNMGRDLGHNLILCLWLWVSQEVATTLSGRTVLSCGVLTWGKCLLPGSLTWPYAGLGPSPYGPVQGQSQGMAAGFPPRKRAWRGKERAYSRSHHLKSRRKWHPGSSPAFPWLQVGWQVQLIVKGDGYYTRSRTRAVRTILEAPHRSVSRLPWWGRWKKNGARNGLNCSRDCCVTNKHLDKKNVSSNLYDLCQSRLATELMLRPYSKY